MLTEEQLCSVCFEQIIPKWHSMPETFPDFLPVFSQEEKLYNEAFISEIRRDLKDMPENPSQEQKEEIKKRMYKLLEKERILHIKEHIPEDLLKEFEESMEGFTKRVEAFDKTLSRESIWQAMRNYLIYAIIVNLQGEDQNCRDTILGYSLLYPYTDNYIDEQHRKNKDKHSYNNLIRKALSGEDICPKNQWEEKTKQLLMLVLNHYADNKYRQKEAARLLLLMLKAQEKSLLQIYRFGTKKPSKEEILRISACKGGISVFLDYMFSIDFHAASVTEEERRFYLSFGLILQIADDLQDMEEDKKNHIRTLITACRNKKERQSIVNRLFHFAHACISEFSPKNPQLHMFMLQNCQLMLLAFVAQNKKYFSKSYLEKIEPHLPVSLRQF